MSKKIKPIILLFLVVFLLSASMVSRAQAGPQSIVHYEDGRLTVDAAKASLLPLLESIARAADIEIFVSEEIKQAEITARLDQEPIEGAMKRLLKSFSHVMTYHDTGKGVALSAVRIYPRGKTSGPLIALKGGPMPGTSTKPGRKTGPGQRPSSPATERVASFGPESSPGSAGLVVPRRYDVEKTQGLAATTGKRFALQEQKVFNDIAALKQEIKNTENEQRRDALNLVLMDKLEAFEAMQRRHRNRMEALHRIELFNETKKE